ncbi:MAG: hypothetical protein ACRDY1_04975 [Acidimicrobiales bacterium]
MADLSDDIRSLFQRGIEPVTFEEIGDRQRRPGHSPRRTVARVAAVAVVVAVAVPVVWAVSSARTSTRHTAGARHGLNGPARRRVISALDTTIASGSFNFTFSQQPTTQPTGAEPTTTTTCPTVVPPDAGTIPGGTSGSPVTTVGSIEGQVEVCDIQNGGSNPGEAIAGQGTIDTNPFAMVVETSVPGLGQVTLRDDGTDVWEIGGGDYGLAPGSDSSGPGSSLPGFAGLVEGTLGARQGASDMMVLANPTGYLELDEDAISSADQIGTDTVNGIPVTVYQVTLNADQEATVAGANATETTAIQNALATLRAQGYTGTTTKISIDAGGYILRTVSTASFGDGSTQTGETTYSDFGCAGTVLMPGQQGASSPPAGCVSPDTTPTTPSS